MLLFLFRIFFCGFKDCKRAFNVLVDLHRHQESDHTEVSKDQDLDAEDRIIYMGEIGDAKDQRSLSDTPVSIVEDLDCQEQVSPPLPAAMEGIEPADLGPTITTVDTIRRHFDLDQTSVISDLNLREEETLASVLRDQPLQDDGPPVLGRLAPEADTEEELKEEEEEDEKNLLSDRSDEDGDPRRHVEELDPRKQVEELDPTMNVVELDPRRRVEELSLRKQAEELGPRKQVEEGLDPRRQVEDLEALAEAGDQSGLISNNLGLEDSGLLIFSEDPDNQLVEVLRYNMDPAPAPVCCYCLKNFESNDQLASHICSVVTDLKCPNCRKLFRSKAELAEHVKMHAAKRFLCNLCAKPFSTNKTLKRHMRSVQKVFPVGHKMIFLLFYAKEKSKGWYVNVVGFFFIIISTVYMR